MGLEQMLKLTWILISTHCQLPRGGRDGALYDTVYIPTGACVRVVIGQTIYSLVIPSSPCLTGLQHNPRCQVTPK
jgi:hypothetical protein